ASSSGTDTLKNKTPAAYLYSVMDSFGPCGNELPSLESVGARFSSVLRYSTGVRSRLHIQCDRHKSHHVATDWLAPRVTTSQTEIPVILCDHCDSDILSNFELIAVLISSPWTKVSPQLSHGVYMQRGPLCIPQGASLDQDPKPPIDRYECPYYRTVGQCVGTLLLSVSTSKARQHPIKSTSYDDQLQNDILSSNRRAIQGHHRDRFYDRWNFISSKIHFIRCGILKPHVRSWRLCFNKPSCEKATNETLAVLLIREGIPVLFDWTSARIGYDSYEEFRSLGQPGSIPALVLPLGGVAARHRKGVTAERFDSFNGHRIKG
ncbi:hypothetical protein CLF_111138, partial [Clonorchis sinensis]